MLLIIEKLLLNVVFLDILYGGTTQKAQALSSCQTNGFVTTLVAIISEHVTFTIQLGYRFWAQEAFVEGFTYCSTAVLF